MNYIAKNIEELVDSYLEKKIILASNWRGRMVFYDNFIFFQY